MELNLGAIARQGAFTAFQAIRRTGLPKQVGVIRAVNEGKTNRQKFRDTALADLLEIAASSPHYAQHAGKELTDYPVLAKSELKSSTNSFRTTGFETSELIPASTSGSYGVPLTLLLTKQKKFRQQAEVIYFGGWADYKVGSPHLYLRAKSPKSRLKLWAQNEWFASTNHPTQEWVKEQVDLIRNKRLHAIIGYPSTIALIAETALELGYSPADFAVKSAITIGEALREEQRIAIESAFGGRCLSRYTAEEVGAIAAECPEEQRHHINEASYIVEVLDLEADEPAKAGELGRIVVTDLFSHAMPLIRYDIGDLGVLGTGCPCGRPTAVLERIEGRTIEAISDVKGQTLNPYFINPIMNGVPGVLQYQFSQTGPESYELRLVGKEVKELDRVRDELLEILGTDAHLQIANVDEIPPLPSGKRPYVINEWRRSAGK